MTKQVIGNQGISFDDFKTYFDYVCGISDINNIENKLPNNLSDLLYEYVSDFIYDLYDVDINDDMVYFLYDKLTNIPLTRISRYCGRGTSGIVFDLGDRVIKYFYKNTIPDDIQIFYNHCLRNQTNTFLPRVYRVGKGYVVMEKLSTIDERTFLDNIQSLSYNAAALMDAMDMRDKKRGDFGEQNFGMRDNGEIVYFDPI